MDLKKKKEKFKFLEREIKLNKLKIKLFKNIAFCTTTVLVLMLIGVLYFSSLLSSNEFAMRGLSVFLITTSIVLFILNLFIKRKELENKELDVKIYRLLKL